MNSRTFDDADSFHSTIRIGELFQIIFISYYFYSWSLTRTLSVIVTYNNKYVLLQFHTDSNITRLLPKMWCIGS